MSEGKPPRPAPMSARTAANRNFARSVAPLRRNLVITRQELDQQVTKATTDAVKRLMTKRAKRAKSARQKLQKSADLRQLMAVRAAPQRDAILELQARFNRTTDPVEKSNLGQELTYQKLYRAHLEGAAGVLRGRRI